MAGRFGLPPGAIGAEPAAVHDDAPDRDDDRGPIAEGLVVQDAKSIPGVGRRRRWRHSRDTGSCPSTGGFPQHWWNRRTRNASQGRNGTVATGGREARAALGPCSWPRQAGGRGQPAAETSLATSVRAWCCWRVAPAVVHDADWQVRDLDQCRVVTSWGGRRSR